MKMKNITGTTSYIGVCSSSTADLKKITMISVLRCVAKARSILTGIKSKTQNLRARFSVFSSFKHERPPRPPPVALINCSRKIHDDHNHHDQAYDHRTTDGTVAAVAAEDDHHHRCPSPPSLNHIDCRDDDKDDYGEHASVIELVRHSKEELGENFCLEAEIDHIADLFIMKFHRKMRLQKLESFKRCQQRVQRSAS